MARAARFQDHERRRPAQRIPLQVFPRTWLVHAWHGIFSWPPLHILCNWQVVARMTFQSYDAGQPTQLCACLPFMRQLWYLPAPQQHRALWAQVRVAWASLPAAAAAPDGGRQHGLPRASAAGGGACGARLLGAWRQRQPRGPAGAQQPTTHMPA